MMGESYENSEVADMAAEIERQRALNAEYEIRIERLQYAIYEGDLEIKRLRELDAEACRDRDKWHEIAAAMREANAELLAALIDTEHLIAATFGEQDETSPTLAKARAAIAAVEG